MAQRWIWGKQEKEGALAILPKELPIVLWPIFWTSAIEGLIASFFPFSGVSASIVMTSSI